MIRVGIHQPNYLPWIGYFLKIASCDVFVFFDNVQMPIGKSFVSRNRIMAAGKEHWLTVPTSRASDGAPIAETPIIPGNWARKHMKTVEVAYARSPWLKDVIAIMSDAALSQPTTIAALNISLIERISAYVGLREVSFMRASQVSGVGAGRGSIMPLLKSLNADIYVTGRGAGTQRSIDEDELAAAAVKLRYLDAGALEFPASYQKPETPLSVLDPLLRLGPATVRDILMRSRPRD